MSQECGNGLENAASKRVASDLEVGPCPQLIPQLVADVGRGELRIRKIEHGRVWPVVSNRECDRTFLFRIRVEGGGQGA
jgi:hypothetical protein